MSSPALAEVALQQRFVKPDVHDGDTLSITAGRHPVVESLQCGTLFVPNDTFLDADSTRLHIITGPNSAGKSTYLRQVALDRSARADRVVCPRRGRQYRPG